MIPALDGLLALAAFLGHFAWSVYLFNRLHALAWPWQVIKVAERVLLASAAGVCLAYAFCAAQTGGFALGWHTGELVLRSGWLAYAAYSWLMAILALPLWLLPKLADRAPAILTANDTKVIDVAHQRGNVPVKGLKASLYARVPGTQILRLHVQRKTICLDDLPPELEGLTIAHLSDLHMTGALTDDFFHEVVDATNALSPDLVVITGDILEKARCLPWIEPTLGRLHARCGKFFVLGNHEHRLGDVAPLRTALAASGLVDLGGRAQVVAINGLPVLFAGTELPWFGTAPEVNNLHTEICKPKFAVLLSHTPDQLPWAKAQGFQLMLAGHNHGGQIRLPWLGALITPSHYGFRYAGGLYHEPPTVLHVSRGVSGVPPIRLNCPPEIALLVLTR